MSLTVFRIAAPRAESLLAESLTRAAGVRFRVLETAELLAAAHEATTRSIVLVDPDVAFDAATLAAIARSESASAAIIGGRAQTPSGDCFGTMLAPERFGPFPFVLASLMGLPGERNIASMFAGPIDVIARGIVTITRSLFLELGGFDSQLEPPFALTDLCFRARAGGADVRCDPTIVFSCASDGPRARRPYASLQLLSERYGSLALHHDPEGVRRRGISREVRLSGGVRLRVRKPVADLTLVVHGPPPSDRAMFLASLRSNHARIGRIVWADARAPQGSDVETAADVRDAVREAMQIRGDRYVGFVRSDAELERGWLDDLIESVEWGSDLAIAVVDRADPTACALVAMRLVPQHVQLSPDLPFTTGFERFSAELVGLRRGIRALDGTNAPPATMPQAADASLSVIFIAGSKPEIVRTSFEMLLGQTPTAREYIVVIPAGTETSRALLANYPRVRFIPDGIDPGLCAGLNAALAVASGDLLLVASDEYYFSDGTASALLSAFERVPALGISAPRCNGGTAPQGIDEVSYVDLLDMKHYAAGRLAAFRRELTFIDRAGTVAFAVDRRVIQSIGGVDERFGLNRFAIEDLALRAQAAGYRVAMCDDVFLHRYAASYSLSPIGHADEDQTLWNAFRRKWSVPSGAVGAYQASPMIDAGFDAKTQYVSLRASAEGALPSGALAAVFIGTIEHEDAWPAASDALRHFFKAYDAADPVVLVIGIGPQGPELSDIGYRLRKLLTAAEIDVEKSMNVEVVALGDPEAFLAGLPAGPRFIAFGARADHFGAIERTNNRSRSALRSQLDETVGTR